MIGQLLHTDNEWFIKHYIGDEDIITRIKNRNNEDDYETILVSANSVSSHQDWLDRLLITKEEPFLKFSIVSYEDKKMAILLPTEENTFDYTNLDYQLGQYVGEYIIASFLPTLNIDSLLTRTVIDVSPEEKLKHEQLEKDWERKVFSKGDEEVSSEEFKILREHSHQLAIKYFEPELKIMVPKVYPKDLKMFRKGLEISIWDCDRSWYWVEDDFFEQTEYMAWCSYIILKLQINGKTYIKDEG